MVRVDEKNVDSFCLTICSLLQASNDAAELSKSPARKWQNIYSEKIEFFFQNNLLCKFVLEFNYSTCPISVASTLDTNKYKLLMKIAIEDLEVIKGKTSNMHYALIYK